jgi:predicted nucleotidyltransferase
MLSMIASGEIIEKAVDFIKEKIAPDKIYLFGSYAKGNPSENSDLDFFIIKSTNLPKHKRALPLYSLGKTRRIGLPIGIDFIVYTPEEFNLMKENPNSLAGEVARTGKIVYAR